MLSKRSRPVQRDQSKGNLMPDSASDPCFSSDVLMQKSKSSSLFSVPGLFVGFSTMGLPDSDSAKSPTSTLDYRVFSNLGNPFRSPKSGLDGPPKIWDCNRVGLVALVDSLNDEVKHCGKFLGYSDSRNIIFGSQMRINIPSLPDSCEISPQNQIESSHLQLGHSDMLLGSGETQLERARSDVSLGSGEIQLNPEAIGKIRSCPLNFDKSPTPPMELIYCSPKSNCDNLWSDTKNSQVGSLPLVSESPNFDKSLGMKSSSVPISIGSGHGFMGCLSPKEIELSEDYTRVISHGPNPKTTHIFGDCILESHTNELVSNCNKQEEQGIISPEIIKSLGDCMPYPTDDFLSFCYCCKKKLEEGKDIYMYRGEKAFCSCSCRFQEILVDEEMEKPENNSPHSPKFTSPDKIFLTGLDFAI